MISMMIVASQVNSIDNVRIWLIAGCSYEMIVSGDRRRAESNRIESTPKRKGVKQQTKRITSEKEHAKQKQSYTKDNIHASPHRCVVLRLYVIVSVDCCRRPFLPFSVSLSFSPLCSAGLCTRAGTMAAARRSTRENMLWYRVVMGCRCRWALYQARAMGTERERQRVHVRTTETEKYTEIGTHSRNKSNTMKQES